MQACFFMTISQIVASIFFIIIFLYIVVRWKDTSSQNDWPLIERKFRFIKRIFSTVRCNLLHGRVDKEWSLHPEFESHRGFCCHLTELNFLEFHFFPPNWKLFTYLTYIMYCNILFIIISFIMKFFYNYC